MGRLRALIAMVAIVVLPIATAAEQTDAAKVVDGLHQSLLDAMKRSKELGYKGRYAALDPVVSASFDFPSIARIVVGKYWSGLKPEEQKNFIETFARLSTATYASRFDSFDGESFRIVSEEKQRGNNMLIKTELTRSDGDKVRLDYLVHNGEDNKWRILNVIADGVSDLSLKRSEYTSIINSEGFAALIAKLNAKIAQYEAPGSAPPAS